MPAPSPRDCESALDVSTVRVEEAVWSACPLAVVFAAPLHFAQAEAAGLIPPAVTRWESRDPHYSVEAGYAEPATRHTLAGPVG